jgi:hypothetical protein
MKALRLIGLILLICAFLAVGYLARFLKKVFKKDKKKAP